MDSEVLGEEVDWVDQPDDRPSSARPGVSCGGRAQPSKQLRNATRLGLSAGALSFGRGRGRGVSGNAGDAGGHGGLGDRA